jgi:NADH:ubiquinone reductase (H+-translocating)
VLKWPVPSQAWCMNSRRTSAASIPIGCVSFLPQRAIECCLRTRRIFRAVRRQSVRIGNDVVSSAVTVWATGVAASPLAKQLSNRLDTVGRVPVTPHLSLPEHRNVFVIGDMAAAEDRDGKMLPGLASVAEQQGAAVARNIARDLQQRRREPFRYRDWGSMATIGRRAAVVQWGRLHLSRTLAWLIWAAVHGVLLLDFAAEVQFCVNGHGPFVPAKPQLV